jgi:hypothetical protein
MPRFPGRFRKVATPTTRVLSWQGEYDAGVAYEISDIITYDGGLYIATAASTGSTPSDLTNWAALMSPPTPQDSVTFGGIYLDAATGLELDSSDGDWLVVSGWTGDMSAAGVSTDAGSGEVTIGPGEAGTYRIDYLLDLEIGPTDPGTLLNLRVRDTTGGITVTGSAWASGTFVGVVEGETYRYERTVFYTTGSPGAALQIEHNGGGGGSHLLLRFGHLAVTKLP